MSREYPAAPLPAVGVVVLRADGRLLLARRANPPAQGLWSLPGGAIELGETVAEAARRETREECGVECDPLPVHHVVDRVFRDADGWVQYHYVIVEVLARWVSGEGSPASDASAVRWFSPRELGATDITPGVDEVVAGLLARLSPAPGDSGG
jgi:ADP-ribose pyrophosphatase YjhB (NUDIX family)